MNTPPDGTPPTMQMYLWHFPGTTDAEEPFLPASGAFDASILYHEYTHGLSNRLVVDATGNSTLNSIQAGSMGEAWSDFYAMDYLVTQRPAEGHRRRRARSSRASTSLAGQPVPHPGDGLQGRIAAPRLHRPDGGDRAATPTATSRTIGGAPEVHASGEVWAQTLWDLRERFGHSWPTSSSPGHGAVPPDPSMLDMRNAIVQADQVAQRRRTPT